MGGKAEKGAVEKSKKTEKEQKKERQEEVKQIVAQIRELMRQEQGTAADSTEWKEFETLLSDLLCGNIKGNATAMSIKLYENIKGFSQGKKNFIEFAKGQQTAKKLLEEMKKVPGAEEYEPIQPLFTFLAHVAEGEGKKKLKKEELGVVTEYGRRIGYMTLLTEEGAKKDLAEAEELLKEFHRRMGMADPEKIRKAQNKEDRDEAEKEVLAEFDKQLKKAEDEGEEFKKARLQGKEPKKGDALEKLVEEAQPILGPM